MQLRLGRLAGRRGGWGPVGQTIEANHGKKTNKSCLSPFAVSCAGDPRTGGGAKRAGGAAAEGAARKTGRRDGKVRRRAGAGTIPRS